MWQEAYLALGSNLGDRLALLQKAVDDLEKDTNIQVKALSSLYETSPVGDVPQPDYLNGVVRICTLYSPDELLRAVHLIEQKANRTREIHWGPRTLDIDILLYADEIIHQADLVIPHKEMKNRGFVLIPLRDVYTKDTLDGDSLQSWIEQTDDRQEVKLYRKDWKVEKK